MTPTEHRRNLADLVTLAQRDLRIILARHDDPNRARDALLLALPKLATIYGAAAASLAADWYDDLRDAHSARGRFQAITALPADDDAAEALVRWSVDPMYAQEPDKVKTLARVAGGLQQLVADAGRQTVVLSSIEDPGAQGWRRVTSGACSFCAGLASGGAVFTSEPDFKSHKNCGCVAAPAFR